MARLCISTARIAAFLLLLPGTAFAVWPLPSYWTHSVPGYESETYQTKIDDRSPRSECEPEPSGFAIGYCLGASIPGKSCPGSGQLCGGKEPRIQSVTHHDLGGGQIQFDIEYDLPNNYCQVDFDNPAIWPIIWPGHATILRIWNGPGVIATSYAIFEHGRWMPTVGCPGGSTNLTIEVTRSCGTPQSGTMPYTVGGDGCPEPPKIQIPPSCPSAPGGVSPAPASAPGKGLLTVSLASGPAFGENLIPGPAAPEFFYNGNSTGGGTGMGPAWNFTYGQTLRVDIPGRLVWTDARGFKRYYVGSDGSGYTASSPGDVLGSITLSGSDYSLATPDGTQNTFVASGGGYWKKTVDRWGNGAQGNTTSTSRPTTIVELSGGLTTGRQVLLQYDSPSFLIRVTDAGGGIWNLGYDTEGRLAKLCAPGMNCTSVWWRSYSYASDPLPPDPAGPTRLTTVMDTASNVIRGYRYDASWAVDQTWIGDTGFGEVNAREKTEFVRTSSTFTVKRTKDGGTADTDYTVEAIAGVWRVTQIGGACPECGQENSTTTYYPTTGRPASRVNGNGHETQWSYDEYGNVFHVVEAVGTAKERSTDISFAVPGTDPMPTVWGSSVRDFWISRSGPSGIKPASTTTTTRAWSGTGNLILSETVAGYTSSSGSVESRTTTTTFDPVGRVTTIDGPRTDVTTDVTTFEYYTNSETSVPARNRLKLKTDPDGTQTQYDTYHALGGVLQQTRKLKAGTQDVDVITQFLYDNRGRVTKRTLKATTGAEQDLETWTGYDSLGRMSETKTLPTSGSVVSRSEYGYENGTDRLLTRTETATTGGAGDRITYSYDDRGNVATESYGFFNGASTSADYQVTRQYDGRCKVRRQTYPTDSATTRSDYDCAGNLVGISDANHYVNDSTPANLTYDYDELSRLKLVTRTASPSNDTTSYTYDARDQLTSVTDANTNQTTYASDDFGALRLKTTTLSGTGLDEVTSYTYDEANNLLSTTQQDVRGTVRTYDGASRLKTVRNDVSSPDLAIDYTYDSNCLADPVTGKFHGQGRLCRVVDGSGTTTYGYDRRGLVVVQQKDFLGGPPSPTVRYKYDAAGRRTEVTYPSGDKTTTSLDVGGRPTSVSYTPSGGSPASILSFMAHKPFGPIRAYTTAAPVTELRTFDTRYRRLDQTTTGSATLMSLAYTNWDKEGNLLAVDDQTLGAPPEYDMTFGYDPDRYTLTSSTGPFGDDHKARTLGWTYDKTGNRLTESNSDLGTTTFGFGTDGSGHSNGVLTSITPPGQSAIPITSLPTGDLQADDSSIEYTYDALGQLESAQISSPSCGFYPATSRLYHDAEGHRAASELTQCGSKWPSRTELYFYGADGNLVYRERRGNNYSLLATDDYVYLEGEPVAIIRTTDRTNLYFLHGDHLGRPLAMTDKNRALVWRPEYEPFGKSRPPRVSLSFVPGFRFPGQWESEDSEDVPGGQGGYAGQLARLTDNWHRSYKQEWGRYSQPDPILGERDATPANPLALGNVYPYADAAPTRLTDPLGLYVVDYGPTCKRLPENEQWQLYLAVQDALEKLPLGGPCTLKPDQHFKLRCANCWMFGTVCGHAVPAVAFGAALCINVGLNLSGGCGDGPGCLTGTIFHEMLHKCTGWFGEKVPRGCEGKFFGSTCKRNDYGSSSNCVPSCSF
jgi:RHS repeat-associated protein